jgi:pyruvate,orthophosphate dikinase
MATTADHRQSSELRYVYSFGGNLAPPPLDKYLLGGKGKGLAEMSSIGLPVPPGFIITAKACNEYQSRHCFPDGLEESIRRAMRQLEAQMGREFGSLENPLLVSVRSGAAISMPGMMDTILNLGLNDAAVIGFARVFNNERLAYDNYRRFIMMYSDIVAGISKKHFEQAFEILKMQEGVKEDEPDTIHGG